METTRKDKIIGFMAEQYVFDACFFWYEETRTPMPSPFTLETMPTASYRIRKEAKAKAEELYNAIEHDWQEKILLDVALEEILFRRLPAGAPMSWAHKAVLTAMGTGVRWEDDELPIVFAGTELTVKGGAGEGLYEWEPLHQFEEFWYEYKDFESGWKKCPPHFREWLSGWASDRPIWLYALQSTGALQGSRHQVNATLELADCLKWLANEIAAGRGHQMDMNCYEEERKLKVVRRWVIAQRFDDEEENEHA